MGMNVSKKYFIIFTDLDGTLIDKVTYTWDKAKPAIEECKRKEIPIIIVSSKTKEEIIKIRDELELKSPFVVENGGGIYFDFGDDPPPEGAEEKDGFYKISLGVSYENLIKSLREISDETGYTLRGFSQMSPNEVSWLTGLSIEDSLRAMRREFDEPFIILNENPDIKRLEISAGKRGLSIVKGGRFYHLKGEIDKGMAVSRIIKWYSKKSPYLISVGLGDGPNDISMLEVVDIPVLVKGGFGEKDMSLQMNNLIITEKEGPEGWNDSVLSIIS